MKKTTAWFYVLLFLSAPAAAEMMNGTVTNIDENNGQVTFVRSDTGQSVTVNVSDASGLGLAQMGGSVTMDAVQGEGGAWSATSLQTLATAGSTNANVTSRNDSPIITSASADILAGSMRGPSITPTNDPQEMGASDSVPGSTGTGASMASSTAADGSPRGTTQSGSVPPDSASGGR